MSGNLLNNKVCRGKICDSLNKGKFKKIFSKGGYGSEQITKRDWIRQNDYTGQIEQNDEV